MKQHIKRAFALAVIGSIGAFGLASCGGGGSSGGGSPAATTPTMTITPGGAPPISSSIAEVKGLPPSGEASGELMRDLIDEQDVYAFSLQENDFVGAKVEVTSEQSMQLILRLHSEDGAVIPFRNPPLLY